MAASDDVLNQDPGQSPAAGDTKEAGPGNGAAPVDVREIVSGVASSLAEQLGPAFEKIGEELRTLKTTDRPPARAPADAAGGATDFDKFYENPTQALDDAFRRNFDVVTKEQIVPALQPIYETVSGIVKEQVVESFEKNFGDGAVNDLFGEKFNAAYAALSPEAKANPMVVSQLMNTLTMDDSTRDKAIERFTKTRQDREEAERLQPPAMMGSGQPRTPAKQLTPAEEEFAKAVNMDPQRLLSVKDGGRTIDDYPYDEDAKKAMGGGTAQ